MKICFLSCEYGPNLAGGEGVVTQSLAEGMAALGHRVRVAGLLERGCREACLEERNGVTIHRLPIPLPRGGGVWARHQLWKQVLAWVKAGEIDVVDAPLGRGLVAGWGALPVPVIVRIHGTRAARMSPLAPPVPLVSQWFERHAAQRADALCAVSRSVAQFVTRRILGENRECTVIPNPVSGLGDARWHPQAPPSVVYSGGMNECKGICELIRVWARVRRRVPEARLLLFGRDSRMYNGASVRDWVCDFLRDPKGLGVEFRGHVSREELALAYRQAGAVVLPSHYEAFGMAAAEAMWCGCPLVFTQYGSGPELIRDGVEGLLVNPHQPDSIAEALLRILLDPEFAAGMGRAAAEKARAEFAIDRVLARNLQFYEDCRARFAAAGNR